ncbi:unnamed protein product [Umbelopsis ramanniana]
MQKHNIKVVDCWRPFVNKQFGEVVDLVDHSSQPMDKVTSDEEEDDDDDAVKDQKQKEVIRSVNVSINEVLRNDLNEDFISHFFQKMSTTQVLATNFYQDLATATTATSLLIIKVAPNSSISANFGSQGVQAQTAKKYPLWQEVNTELRNSDFNFAPSGLSPLVMSDVCTKLTTNIKNMWKGNKKRNKALDNILEILLCLHLRPTAELARIAKVVQVKDKRTEAVQPTITKNRRRSNIKKQKRLIELITEKMRTGEEDTIKLQARIDNCHKRIEKYQAIPSKKKKGKKAVTKSNDDGEDNDNDNDDDNDDDVEDADDDVDQESSNSDISIRRLRRFKGMLKSLLLKGAIIGTSKHELVEKSVLIGRQYPSKVKNMNLIHHERACLPRFPSIGNRIQKLPITEAERTVATQTLEVVLSNVERLNDKLKANVKSFKLAAFNKAIQEYKRRYTHGDTSVYLEIKRLKGERDWI